MADNIKLTYYMPFSKKTRTTTAIKKISIISKQPNTAVIIGITGLYEHWSLVAKTIATILSLGQNAYQIFQSSKVETKREILHLLLSNLKLKDRKISYTLRKPYDYIRSLNKKIPSKTEGITIGDPNGIRTHITTVKG